eukprot:g29212.t1
MSRTVNKTLQALGLRSNNIGDDGAKAIGEALEANNSIRSIDLRSNIIGDEGAKAIVLALQANQVLQTLIIAGNNIGDQGAAAFADALKATILEIKVQKRSQTRLSSVTLCAITATSSA